MEAEQVMITSKLPGRLAEVLAEEGQMVDAGAVLARLDATEIEAELQAAEAQSRRAEQAVTEANSALTLRASIRKFAIQELDRTTELREKGFATVETFDRWRSEVDAAEAAYQAGEASLGEAKSALDAARADVARLKSVLNDTILAAPRRGRIQYKLMQAGEVVAPGSRVLTLIDLTDIYMTVYLPARVAGYLAIDDEARLILDPIPQYVIPAAVSFVAPMRSSRQNRSRLLRSGRSSCFGLS
jgi:HlyD family secretion protein